MHRVVVCVRSASALLSGSCLYHVVLGCLQWFSDVQSLSQLYYVVFGCTGFLDAQRGLGAQWLVRILSSCLAAHGGRALYRATQLYRGSWQAGTLFYVVANGPRCLELFGGERRVRRGIGSSWFGWFAVLNVVECFSVAHRSSELFTLGLCLPWHCLAARPLCQVRLRSTQ